jgi:hypothetical protein
LLFVGGVGTTEAGKVLDGRNELLCVHVASSGFGSVGIFRLGLETTPADNIRKGYKSVESHAVSYRSIASLHHNLGCRLDHKEAR